MFFGDKSATLNMGVYRPSKLKSVFVVFMGKSRVEFLGYIQHGIALYVFDSGQPKTCFLSDVLEKWLERKFRKEIHPQKFNSSLLKIGKIPKGNENVFQPSIFRCQLAGFVSGTKYALKNGLIVDGVQLLKDLFPPTSSF